ncbi:MAG TPA: DUF6502 family protein [Vicinamibacterales bacterium]|nr:DUF6502 family protein [Vicinamibacterales bacterium]
MERESALLRAVRRWLRPIIRQLLRHGITYGAFSQLAKQVYYEVASDEFALPDRKQSDSRVALITGLTRRDVAALRTRVDRVSEAALDVNLATRLINYWTTEPRFLTETGTPKQLPLESRRTGAPSFAQLVRDIGGDIPPRALLDELVRVKCVELQATRSVRLLQRAYIPANDSPERIEMMGEDVSEFANVIAHNLENPPHDAFLQQKVVYDNIGELALTELRAELRRLGEAFLRRVNRLIATRDRDRNPKAPGGARKRVALGVYYSQDDGDDVK